MEYKIQNVKSTNTDIWKHTTNGNGNYNTNNDTTPQVQRSQQNTDGSTPPMGIQYQ
jgi:hypothetical protein